MAAVSLDEVLDLMATWGTHRYDEMVSQLEHALQCAALAQQASASDELVAAALLHDVGHLLELRSGGSAPGPGGEDRHHEQRGARWLAGVFPAAVTGPIALHVAAKRYLCAVDPRYRAGLSAGSERSLARQGGPMDRAELQRFARHPAHDNALQLRRWDDCGKVEDLDVADLDHYRDLLVRAARGTQAGDA
jgi:phosphonate degradation associated HDIG domain protein